MTTEYLKLLDEIHAYGVEKDDRTGVGTRSLFAAQMRFDLSKGFPLLTTKKLPMRWIAQELLWMLSGSTDEGELRAAGVDIWKEWATEEQCARFGRAEGDLGPTYGHQWRNFGATTNQDGEYYRNGFDQILGVVRMLREDPDSRRNLLTGWNPLEATRVALPPCHTLAQFYVAEGKLSTQLYMRSADAFLGVPFNLAAYALLTHMLAQVAGLDVGWFVQTFGDVHVYNNHWEAVGDQLQRTPRPLPTLLLDPSIKEIDDFEWRHIEMKGYKPHPKISAEVAV